ncbi:MAG TPA: response regulator [Steroidobacteraceae bacterium]|jgi:FixJ family two-component response regulator
MGTQSAVISSQVDAAPPSLLQPDEDSSANPVVHVIDDDDSFRRSMLRILQALGYDAVGYGCAGEFLLAMCSEPAGCILLDITMPGPSGIDLLRAMMQRGAVPPTIFVTARDDIMTSVSAMKMGAFDYLVKPVSAERMLSVVERAMQLDAQRIAAQRELQALCARFAGLTNAERAIFAGVTTHRLNKQMAGDLGACERTIKALRARMMAKLNVTTVPELVRSAALLEHAGVSLGRAASAEACEHDPVGVVHRTPFRLSAWRPSLLRPLPARN